MNMNTKIYIYIVQLFLSMCNTHCVSMQFILLVMVVYIRKNIYM